MKPKAAFIRGTLKNSLHVEQNIVGKFRRVGVVARDSCRQAMEALLLDPQLVLASSNVTELRQRYSGVTANSDFDILFCP